MARWISAWRRIAYLLDIIVGAGGLMPTAMDLRAAREMPAEIWCSICCPLDAVKIPVRTADGCRSPGRGIYVALNQPVDNRKVAGGVVSSNFNSGLRCHVVNGWFCCISPRGEFLWHLSEEVAQSNDCGWSNSRALPGVDLQFALYAFFQPTLGNQQSFYQTARSSARARMGAAIHWPSQVGDHPEFAIQPKFSSFAVDIKGGTISLIGKLEPQPGEHSINVVEQIVTSTTAKKAMEPGGETRRASAIRCQWKARQAISG